MSKAHAALDRLPRLRALAHRWRRDQAANVSLTYALALIPTITLLGLGTDWFEQQSFKKRLDAAADSAALAAITTAKAYVSANSATQSNPVPNALAAGKAQAAKTFAVNAGAAELNISVTPQISFPVPANQTYTATVSYSTSMPTNFGRLVGTRSFPISGSATSTLTIGQYIDFYVVLDVSGSMGIPTTTAGQSALALANPDNRANYPSGCVFACHYPGNQGYTVAKDPKNNIALRVDTVGQAVTALLNTATSQEQQNAITNEFRVGLYPFIVHPIDAAPLNSNFTTAALVASNLGGTYLDQGWSSATAPTASNGTQIGSGGTHFENLINDMPNYIKPNGNGQTAAAPKPFLVLVTDGVDNSQTYTTSNGFTGPTNPSSDPQLPTTNFCTLAKNAAANFPGSANFTVAVLYIPYVPISNPNSTFGGMEDVNVNNLIASTNPGIVSTLQGSASSLNGCSTPGFFFMASSPTDINNAMQTIFFQALQVARLSQ